VAQAAQKLPCWPRSGLVLVPGVLLFFFRRRTKLAGYILACVPAGSAADHLIGSLAAGFPKNPRPSAHLAPDWPQRWMGSFNALVLAVMAIAAAFAPRWAPHRSGLPDFAQALESSGPATGAALVWLSLLLGSFSLLPFQKRGRPRCFWAPNLLGFAAWHAAGCFQALAPF